MDQDLLSAVLTLAVAKSDPQFPVLLSIVQFAFYFLITAFGAAVLQIFSIRKGFQSSVPFLKQAFPGRTDRVYLLSDLILTVFFGALVGTIIFDPSNVRQALAAGFGWVGAINIMLKEPEDV